MMQLPKMFVVLMCCHGVVGGLGLYAHDHDRVIYDNPQENTDQDSSLQVELFESFNRNAFEELSLSDQERTTIEKIVHSLSMYNVPKLLWHQKKLEKMGRSINHVHPLKFISYIINDPLLRSDLQEVHRSFFKWRGFLDGFRRRMTEEFYKDNLQAYLPGFCEELHVKIEVIDHFINHRDWEGLVTAILY